MGVKIKQFTLEEIEEIDWDMYDNYKFLFIATKEHLKLNDELLKITKHSSFFDTLFIRDLYMLNKNQLKNDISFVALLRISLSVFLNIDINSIAIDENKKSFIISNNDGKIIFILNNDNFEEFSEMIRLICCCDKLSIKKEEKTSKRKYKDQAMQEKYESLKAQLKKNEDKEKHENELTIADMIGAVCINENTKYNFENISKLTIWQLYYQFSSMFVKENIEMTKLQFTSEKFKFDKTPDMNWLKKVKVKVPKNIELK